MASNPPSACCATGVKHEGTPTGEHITIANGTIKAYVARANPSKARANKAILYLADINGIWQNAELIADQLAANGYTTLIPDLFNGDLYDRASGPDLPKWIETGTKGDNPHTPDAVDPIVVASIKALREDFGATAIGAVGYCFGSKYVCRHYKSGINVGYAAHPSFVSKEELEGIGGPLSIAAAETDSIFPAEKRRETEEILNRTDHPWQLNLYSGTEHGFAVRIEVTNKKQRFAKEQAFLQAVNWFDAWLL